MVFAPDTYQINGAPDVDVDHRLHLLESDYRSKGVRHSFVVATTRRPERGESMSLSSSDEAWESLHRNHILDEAEKFAAILPELEWTLCGPMRIQRTSSVGDKQRLCGWRRCEIIAILSCRKYSGRRRGRITPARPFPTPTTLSIGLVPATPRLIFSLYERPSPIIEFLTI